MTVRVAVACASMMAVLWTGCDATARYRVLSVLFDGVPPPGAPEKPGAEQVARLTALPPARRVVAGTHGPYAARQCTACHESAANNRLVVPREELCFRCHELKLDKKYIHGPLASGGCTACHDPHSSGYRYLLRAEAETFCVYCHDRQAVASVAAHAGVDAQCTLCHDAHMSDKQYLLR